MEKIKKITVSLKRWQQTMIIAVVLFVIAQIMVATMPDYWLDKDGHAWITASQFFHCVIMVASGGGSIVLAVISVAYLLGALDA